MMPFMMKGLRYPFLSKIIFCQTIQFVLRNMKKRNEDMNFDNGEDALDFINRLLERLHHADYKVLGSIEINIYKSGSQHIDTQVIASPCPPPKGRG